jgi:hypothetical protein
MALARAQPIGHAHDDVLSRHLAARISARQGRVPVGAGSTWLRLPASRCDSQSEKNCLKIRRAAGIEELAQCRFDDGAIARAFIERQVAHFTGCQDVKRDGEARVALCFCKGGNRLRRRDKNS